MIPDSSPPLVSVVTVNHNGWAFLVGLLESLRRQTYRHFEVVVVDNASSDGSPEKLRELYPWVRVLKSPANRGFVGGNNLGFSAGRGDLFALINNDAVADPEWLGQMVAEIESSRRIGAVCSKILFARPYLRVVFDVPTFSPARLGPSTDPRELGVFVEDGTGFAGCSYRKSIFREGFYAAETVGGEIWRWSAGHAVVDLPVEHRDGAALLCLRAAGGLGGARELRVRVGSAAPVKIGIDGYEREHTVEVPRDVVSRDAFEVINNAGSFLSPEGVAGDRGIYEPDRGQYDGPGDLEAFCGCSVLLRRQALVDAGVFDRDFFMYFEDTELSWRIRKRGYRLSYQPRSVVRHHHAGSIGEDSPLFVFLVTRNRILMLLKHAPLALGLRAYAEELARTVRLAIRQRSLRTSSVRSRLRVQVSLLRQAPRALLKRYGLLREETVVAMFHIPRKSDTGSISTRTK